MAGRLKGKQQAESKAAARSPLTSIPDQRVGSISITVVSRKYKCSLGLTQERNHRNR